MAVVKKSQGATPSSPSTPAVKAPKLSLTLSTVAREPSSRVQDYSYLFYGRKGIGKTSFAAQFPGAYFLALEPGDRALRVKASDVPDWEHFVGYIDLIAKKNDPDMTTVVDVIDLGYDYVYHHICKKLMIESPKDMDDWGHTWRRISSMFREQVHRLISLPGGVIFLSHDTERTIETRHGEVERTQPTMSKQALAQVEGLVDFCGLYEYDESVRVMHIRGSQTVVAKCRFEERFIRKGGKPRVGADAIQTIPMGASSMEAYKNFLLAFNNDQETVDGQAPRTAKKSFKLSSTK